MFDQKKFDETVSTILDIMNDLDEFDTPKRKLPNCPRCDEDELGVMHADFCICYACNWKIEGRTNV